MTVLKQLEQKVCRGCSVGSMCLRVNAFMLTSPWRDPDCQEYFDASATTFDYRLASARDAIRRVNDLELRKPERRL